MDSAPTGTVAEEAITPAELRLATRNHGLPLEALRYPITPAGLHYLLIHYDIPAVEPDAFRLEVGGAVERSAQPLARRPAGPRAGLAARHLRVRRQRSRPAGAPADQSALAHRGGRHRRMGRHAPAPAPRRGGHRRIRRRGPLHRARPRRRGRRAAGLRALAVRRRHGRAPFSPSR